VNKREFKKTLMQNPSTHFYKYMPNENQWVKETDLNNISNGPRIVMAKADFYFFKEKVRQIEHENKEMKRVIDAHIKKTLG